MIQNTSRTNSSALGCTSDVLDVQMKQHFCKTQLFRLIWPVESPLERMLTPNMKQIGRKFYLA